MTQRHKIALTASIITALPLLLAAVVLIARVNLKRVFLSAAGFVVGGVKDDVGVVAAVSISLLAVLWLVIIARSIYEAQAEQAIDQASAPDDRSVATGP